MNNNYVIIAHSRPHTHTHLQFHTSHTHSSPIPHLTHTLIPNSTSPTHTLTHLTHTHFTHLPHTHSHTHTSHTEGSDIYSLICRSDTYRSNRLSRVVSMAVNPANEIDVCLLTSDGKINLWSTFNDEVRFGLSVKR